VTDTGHEDLAAALRRSVRGDVRFDTQARALYAADASNYRHVPVGVVLPRDVDDLIAAVAVCREHDAAVIHRGGGTSIGGQACGDGVVIDSSAHLTRIGEIDPDRQLATVEPGVVLDRLQEALVPHGLMFAPDPSTHSRCTVGGMIGNNACGVHSVRYGTTAANVESLDVLLYDGTRLDAPAALRAVATEKGQAARLLRGLDALVATHGEALRTGFPDLPRRVSGYALDALLPERGRNLAAALTGTEGTCVTVLGATVRLVPRAPHRALLVAGFSDAVAAATSVPALLEQRPLGLEGFDALLLECLEAVGHRRTDMLPRGASWLIVEMGGESPAEAVAAAEQAQHALGTGAVDSRVVADLAEQRAVWRIREEGAGLSSRLPGGREAWSGWEDAAVPPARLPAYLTDFQELMAAHGRRGVVYGHYGDGCIHVRLDFDLRTESGVAAYRRFLEEAATLVAAHGGSLSGEHGDGQARSELLGRMYGPELLEAFSAFKRLFDPRDRMNPGVIVRPRRVDSDLRLRLPVRVDSTGSGFAFPADGGSLATAAARCVGVGACRRTSGGVMCPSWMATGEEQHSTRGRARLLQEMAAGDVIEDGWRSDAVADALDLCLGCKACRNDCPVGVDMATYKAEFLHQRYRGRPRPASHYSMGWMPLTAVAARRLPRTVNAITHAPLLATALKRAGGISGERDLPRFATEPFTRWFARHQAPALDADAPEVMLWPDTFTNSFDPHIGRAAVQLLEAGGFRVTLPQRGVCCGLTWISTGQLGVAKQILRRTVRTLDGAVRRGVPIVGLEPSCIAVFRADLTELLPRSAAAHRLAGAVHTVAEFVAAHRERWAFAARQSSAVRQTHCHQHAVMGSEPDAALLTSLEISETPVEPGCCGLAGNFGFERGHEAVSAACAARTVVPAMAGADASTLLLADGFSCRTQIAHTTGRRARHLVEVLAESAEPASG
jgi:FAD/FMN-containing dehydrogenase/Fe-S oxidoreductase